MKTKVKEISYDKFLKIKGYKHRKPIRRSIILATVIRIASMLTMISTKFKYTSKNMEKLGIKEPCLILMNHSSFTDMKIASKLLYPRKYNIVCSDDAFIGKEWLMRFVGCVPTKKYITDATLVRDMLYCIKELKSSILMYPEACYSFDGTSTTIPNTIGKCIKLLKVPVVMITTYGAFLRDPLYNNLQLRKTNVSAHIEYLLSKEDVQEKNEKEIMEIINNCFSFDNFKWQQDNKIQIKEKFRADYLNRVLYKCPHCLKEGVMEGKGENIICHHCGNEYHLDEFGYLKNTKNETIFDSIPKWYKWERECVKEEVENGTYSLDEDVEIYAIKNLKCVYKLGDGHLKHDINGFTLTGFDGKLEYKQKGNYSYTLGADFFWYELGDLIFIGDNEARYYCVPKTKKDIVAKTRLAAEEIYKKSI